MKRLFWVSLILMVAVSFAYAEKWYQPPGGNATQVSDTDRLAIEQGGVTRAITRGKLLEGVVRGTTTDNSSVFNNYTSTHGKLFAQYTSTHKGGAVLGNYSGASIQKLFIVTDAKYAGGAKGDGSNNDAAAIQAAVNAARAVRGIVYFPNGTYRIQSTVELSDGTLPPPTIRGESARGVTLTYTMSGTTPCLRDKRNTVTFPNKSVIENLTIQPVIAGNGTAIEVSGAVGEIFRNVYINQAKYGIWLHDDSGPNTWTELNVFEDVWLDYCENAIRIEKGTGNGSFHGNTFQRVNINIGANQIGINHLSGYWYNAAFNIAMWVTSNSATIVNADSNAENNTGSITLEILQPAATQAKITGAGRFWYTGAFNFQGGSIVDTAGHSTDGSGVFMSSNYRYAGVMQDSLVSGFKPSISTFNPHSVYNGRDGMGLFQLNADGNTSYLINGYGGGWLFTSNSPYSQPVENASVGLAVNLDGSAITSYHAGGMGLLTGPSEYAAYIKDGQFYVGSPDRKMRIIPGLGDPTNVVLGDPGNLFLANSGGTGSMWLKESGAGTTAGWSKVVTGSTAGTGNASTLDGFSASQTPTGGQIPVLKTSGSLVVPNNVMAQGQQLMVGTGSDNGAAGTIIYSGTIDVTSNRDVLLVYNDRFSGVMTVTYTGTGRYCVKSFNITAANGHAPVSSDYLKQRSFYSATSSLGVPYIKFTTDGTSMPHLYIPLINTVADGKLTVTFTSDTGHHPWFLPSSAAGSLGSLYNLTGL